MSVKEGLLAVGTSLFVCSGVAGLVVFLAVYYFIMGMGK